MTPTWVDPVLDFVAAIVWPAAVVGVIIGFRHQIGERIAHLTKFSAPGTTAEFAEAIAGAQGTLAEIGPAVGDGSGESIDGDGQVVDDDRVVMSRDVLQHLVAEFASAGWAIRDLGGFRSEPRPIVRWNDAGQPYIDRWEGAVKERRGVDGAELLSLLSRREQLQQQTESNARAMREATSKADVARLTRGRLAIDAELDDIERRLRTIR